MATSKKTPKRAKRPSPSLKATNAKLLRENKQLRGERDEALEHQTATAEVLSIISRSPTDVQPVLDAIVESAARVCGIDDVVLRLREGQAMVPRAHFGSIPIGRVEITSDEPQFRWVNEHGTLHISDARAQTDFPMLGSAGVSRTILIAPLRQHGDLVGALIARRIEVRPFTAAQIKLLETFADQAVIAIENARLFNELKESLEQQTATSEILGVIASSPTEIQPVLETITERAARVCGAEDGVLRLVDGNVMRLAAHYGSVPDIAEERPINRQSPSGRALVDRGVVHVENIALVAETEYPEIIETVRRVGAATILAVPLIREGVALGVIHFRRLDVRPFTEKQITLLKTFADQAVIAIENVRLFKELGDRNAELREALEHQTATSEVLSIISRSPTDVQPVLDAIVESAAKACGIDDVVLRLRESDMMTVRAHFGAIPHGRVKLSFGEPQFNWYREHGTLHIPDVRAQTDFPSLGSSGNHLTHLAVPLRQRGELIGVLIARSREVRPFTPAQIKLLETFADQAVIAVENVRLFQELKESLEQQTATSEILGVIASSPTDIQPVLDAIVESIARVCSAEDASVRLVDGEVLRLMAHVGPIPSTTAALRIADEPLNQHILASGETVHIRDILAEDDPMFAPTRARVQPIGLRTFVYTPLMRKGQGIGTIGLRRLEVKPFTDSQIRLLEIFAAQAVIAIENVRLFKELGDRNAELREALEHQTATAEVLGIISRSPTDVQPVLDAIVESAAKVCGIDDVVLRLRESDAMTVRAHFGPIPTGRPQVGVDEAQYRWISEHGALHIPDIQAQNDFPGVGTVGNRTYLAVPLLQQEEFVGVLAARRMNVQPFTPAQIKLLQTFADQAVIAIENVRLFKELEERNRQITEALEQQTATSEILRVIASSPTDIQPVLDVVAQNAAKLCDATDAWLHHYDGETLRLAAQYGQLPQVELTRLVSRKFPAGRAILDRKTIHIDDVLAQIDSEYPDAREIQQSTSTRTVLASPLLREGIPIGVVVIRRQEVRPFTAAQINLLETFADQAVIAIENVRLFKELQERNSELREALEHQTATAEVLGIISRSPTDVQPVLDAIVESAAKVCGIDDVLLRLREGNTMVSQAHFGPLAIGIAEMSIDAPQYRWLREHGTLHVPDNREQPELLVGLLGGSRTLLIVPLRQQGELIGSLNARRTEVRPFTPAQIKLMETFADQAVIAIENVRLFQELTESLEQQTATSEILGVIAGSPTDIQPVLDTVAANAARVCGATDASIFMQVDGTRHRKVAGYGSAPGSSIGTERPLNRDSVTGRVMVDRETIYIDDFLAVARDYSASAAQREGYRTMLGVPLLRKGMAIGMIGIRRMEVRPFSDKQIGLLKTFADQAVIAIENVRLFKELGERNAELREALEHQTATAEVLGIISRSPTDVQPVLDAIVESAAKVCGIDDVVLRLREEKIMVLRAHFGPMVVPPSDISIDEPEYRWVFAHGTLHIPDLTAQRKDFPTLGSHSGFLTFLAAPLRQQEKVIGSLNARRTDVRPFTPAQIKLLETFADQAVIAIENVRLFNELKESLEQQTATSEILGVIASSPTDIQPVLDVIAENAARLAGAGDAQIRLIEGDGTKLVASYGSNVAPAFVPSSHPSGRALAERRQLHIDDLRATMEAEYPDRQDLFVTRSGTRTFLSTPMLREGTPVGLINIRRSEVKPFTDKQMGLVRTFADQAVIAIENVRLFKELEERNRQITEALEQQTATSEILRVIASSPTDIQPVLDVVAENAARLCDANDGLIYREVDEHARLAARYGSIPVLSESLPISSGFVGGRAMIDRRTIHVLDVVAEIETEYPDARRMNLV